MYWSPHLCGSSTPDWSFKVPIFAVQTYGPLPTLGLRVNSHHLRCSCILVNYSASVLIHHNQLTLRSVEEKHFFPFSFSFFLVFKILISFSCFADAFSQIVRDEGYGALWNGTFPSLLLVLNPAIQFMIYEGLKRQLRRGVPREVREKWRGDGGILANHYNI